MFSTTKFPADAWYITRTFSVLPCFVIDKLDHAGWYDTSQAYKQETDLFPTFAAALDEAERRLGVDLDRNERARVRLRKQEDALKKLRAGGAV